MLRDAMDELDLAHDAAPEQVFRRGNDDVAKHATKIRQVS